MMCISAKTTNVMETISITWTILSAAFFMVSTSNLKAGTTCPSSKKRTSSMANTNPVNKLVSLTLGVSELKTPARSISFSSGSMIDGSSMKNRYAVSQRHR